ncbi:EAL domain-containing protein [Cohnella thermotolerans]|uniref:EAL domain-containing protein n=2 Tax=Bacteria TaxID=2 RepID=UPI00047E35DF|nr:EAL domain-containing protein [Cohnella thermotolerans]
MNVRLLLDRIALGAKLFLTDRSLKYFPPDFTFRRPLLSLLDKHMKRGDECYLALFRWECPAAYADMRNDLLPVLQEWMRRQLRKLPSQLGDERDLIGMDQYGPQEFVVLIRGDRPAEDEFVPASLYRKLDRYRHALELGAAGVLPEHWLHLKLTGTYVPLKSVYQEGGTTAEERLKDAYQFALALATNQVTPQVITARRQLDQILQKGDISVLAQPIMNLNNGDIFGWEILTRGPAASVFHLPDQLFRFANQSKQLSKLEFLVVKHALAEVASRRIREPVFLNVTAVTLGHPMFLSHVLQCLERHPALFPSQIVFEITERHEVEDFRAMVQTLERFRKFGFRFAVDDMGAGYSSLQWIGELVPELIKIDRSVIQFVDRFAVKESLLRAIVTAAREMSCEVVAEGVEREEEADVLFRLNVGMGQGYYFAKPNVLLREEEREAFQETKERIQCRRDQVAS